MIVAACACSCSSKTTPPPAKSPARAPAPVAPSPPPVARQDAGTWLCGPVAFDECKARCDAGNALSCARRGEHLYFGASNWRTEEKVEIDRAAARVAFQRSCDLGYPRACATLGLIVGAELDDEFDEDHKGDTGGPTDAAAAAALYRRACDGEVAIGCAMLARHADAAEKRRLTDRACALGDAEACVDRADTMSDDDLHEALAGFHRAMHGAPVGSKRAAARVTCAADHTAVETASGVSGLGGPETYCATADGTKDGPSIEWASDEDLVEGPEHGTKREEIAYRAGKREGHARRWDDDGTLKAEGDYHDDKETGVWTFSSGGDSESGPYVDGEREGAWVEKDDHGGRTEGAYHAGKKDGVWTEYLDFDQVFRVVHYAAGEQDGDDTRTWPNGQKCVSHFAHGDEIGVRTCWMKGRKTLEMPFANGQPDGVEREWADDDGHLDHVGTWRAGKKVGVWTTYYANGKKMEEAVYKDGEQDSSRTWDEHGKPQ